MQTYPTTESCSEPKEWRCCGFETKWGETQTDCEETTRDQSHGLFLRILRTVNAFSETIII